MMGSRRELEDSRGISGDIYEQAVVKTVAGVLLAGIPNIYSEKEEGIFAMHISGPPLTWR